MSGATYRIEIVREPEMSLAQQWRGVIYRAQDGTFITSVFRRTPDEALSAARNLIAETTARPEPVNFYVGDDGQDAEAPHSVKV